MKDTERPAERKTIARDIFDRWSRIHESTESEVFQAPRHSIGAQNLRDRGLDLDRSATLRGLRLGTTGPRGSPHAPRDEGAVPPRGPPAPRPGGLRDRYGLPSPTQRGLRDGISDIAIPKVVIDNVLDDAEKALDGGDMEKAKELMEKARHER